MAIRRNWFGLVVLLTGGLAQGEELQAISLPPPQTEGAPLLAALKLGPEERIILAQAVGYPKE